VVHGADTDSDRPDENFPQIIKEAEPEQTAKKMKKEDLGHLINKTVNK
jgi:hypothetical protein